MPSLHVRHGGTSREIPFEDIFTDQNLEALGLTAATTPQAMNPTQIKQLVSSFLDVNLADFDAYEIDFHKNQNIIVRPEAEFGDMDKTRRDALLRGWRNDICGTNLTRNGSVSADLFVGFLLGKGCSIEEATDVQMFKEALDFVLNPNKEIW